MAAAFNNNAVIVVKNLWAPNLDILETDDTDAPKIIYLASRGQVLTYPTEVDRGEAALVLTIANMMGTALVDKWTPAAGSRTIFRQYILNHVCAEGVGARLYAFENEAYAAWEDRPTSLPENWGGYANAQEALLANQAITPEHMLILAKWLVQQSPSAQLKNIGYHAYMGAYVAVAKLGVISEEKCTRLAAQMQAEGLPDPQLSMDRVAYIHRYLPNCITEQNAQAIFEHLAERMTPLSLSLRASLILHQTAHSGLTAFYSIVDAKHNFPDFPWQSIVGLLKTDVANFIAAKDLVGKNAYFKFRRDLGIAKSTMYKSADRDLYNRFRSMVVQDEAAIMNSVIKSSPSYYNDLEDKSPETRKRVSPYIRLRPSNNVVIDDHRDCPMGSSLSSRDPTLQ